MLCGISLDVHRPKIIFSIRFIFPSTLRKNILVQYVLFLKEITVLLKVPICHTVENCMLMKASICSSVSGIKEEIISKHDICYES